MAAQEFPSTYEPITNIVLVGRTGYGKSATGNSLLGHEIFVSKKNAAGVTKMCKTFRAAIQDGSIINVIDTPGLLGWSVPDDYLCKEIMNCLLLAGEGIHAVLFVVSAMNRLAQEEVESTLDTLQRMFGRKILDYFIVVFTGGDVLESDDLTLDDYLQDCPEYLTRILTMCRGRKVLFNNRTYNQEIKDGQRKQLLAHVADIRKQNSGIPYTEKLRRQIKELNVLTEQKMDIKAKNLAYIEEMKEKLQMEHERTMNEIMMAHIVEGAFKQSEVSQKKEMQELKDTLQSQVTNIIKMVAQMVENALKNGTTSNEIDKLCMELELNGRNTQTMYMVENMVKSALKRSEETHEKEMHQLKNTLQLNESQTMNMIAQMSAAHERKMYHEAQTRASRGSLPEHNAGCIIM